MCSRSFKDLSFQKLRNKALKFEVTLYGHAEYSTIEVERTGRNVLLLTRPDLLRQQCLYDSSFLLQTPEFREESIVISTYFVSVGSTSC